MKGSGARPMNSGDVLNRVSLSTNFFPRPLPLSGRPSKRVLKMRHFDVQLIGGVILHEGKIAEMKTGEGKTLVATLPVYLNALTGNGVHVVTVNDYLAQRDAPGWVSSTIFSGSASASLSTVYG